MSVTLIIYAKSYQSFVTQSVSPPALVSTVSTWWDVKCRFKFSRAVNFAKDILRLS